MNGEEVERESLIILHNKNPNIFFKVEVKESSVLSGPNYLEVSSLEPNRRYDIWVKAATLAGYGPSSVITSIILGRSANPHLLTDWMPA